MRHLRRGVHCRAARGAGSIRTARRGLRSATCDWRAVRRCRVTLIAALRRDFRQGRRRPASRGRRCRPIPRAPAPAARSRREHVDHRRQLFVIDAHLRGEVFGFGARRRRRTSRSLRRPGAPCPRRAAGCSEALEAFQCRTRGSASRRRGPASVNTRSSRPAGFVMLRDPRMRDRRAHESDLQHAGAA